MALNLIKEEEQEPWYSHGLRFKCTECGKCCTGAPGYIWVTEEEIQQIAQYLKLSIEEFSRKFLRITSDNRISLIECAKSYDCIFLKDKKCQIYPVRPKQCRTFPWWHTLLKSEADWQAAAKYCEGINEKAELVDYTTIKKNLDLYEI